jgi:hybrid cluster-associated redox disulfide protein
MNKTELARMIVNDVLTRWPIAVRAFNRLRMSCPGCAMAPFETVGEVCAAYGVKVGQLADAIREEREGPSSNGTAQGGRP